MESLVVDPSTHWASCWREPGHRLCALGAVEELAVGAEVLMLDVLGADPADPNALEMRHRLRARGLLPEPETGYLGDADRRELEMYRQFRCRFPGPFPDLLRPMGGYELKIQRRNPTTGDWEDWPGELDRGGRRR